MSEDGNEFWLWAGPDGSLKTVEQAELLGALGNGAIGPKTLVWRQGWAEWLRAAEVKELSSVLPADLRSAAVAPRLSPDATHPPPIPVQAGAQVKILAPIIPVTSSPEHDKPGTEILVETELSATDLELVKAPAAPPPSKRTPPPPSRRPPGPNLPNAPIVPVASSPENDKPVTQMLDDSEIVIEEPKAAAPPGKWAEVAPAAVEPKPAPAKVEPAKASPPLASSPSLDSLAAAVEAKKPAPVVTPAPAPRPAPVIAVGKPSAKPAPKPAPAIVPVSEPVSEGPTQMMDPIVPVSDPENEAPTRVVVSPLRDDGGLPSWSADVDAELAAGVAAPLPPPPAAQHPSYGPPPVAAGYAASPSYAPPAAYPSYAPPPKKGGFGLILAAVGGLGVLGALAAGGALLYFKPWESSADKTPSARPSATAKASASSAAAAAASGKACTVAKTATKLSPEIVMTVPPYVAAVPGAPQVAVGFASAEATGRGVVLEVETLKEVRATNLIGGKRVVGTVPILLGEPQGFVTDREGGLLGLAHTVDAKTPFAVGFAEGGYARSVQGGAADLIWSGVENQKATEARVASVAGKGHVVTFRTNAEVRVGWLGADGSKASALGTVQSGEKAGTPTVAANDSEILVAFASRASDDAPWTVQLANAKHGELPGKSRRFALPSGGPGGDAIAPTVAGLAGGRWLVQWTEGKAGERVVRAQTLDRSLSPLGDALQISAAGKDAGQGVVAVAADGAAALHLVKSASGYELWGTALACK